MTNGEDQDENTETVSEVPEIPALQPIPYLFFEKILRRVYLEDTPNLIGSIVSTGSTFPSSPSIGQLFWRTDSEKFYIFDGTDWRQILVAQVDGITRMPGRTVQE